MQQPGGLLRPPVQKLVASLLFATGEKAIESLILSRINSGVRTSEVHAKAAHTGGFFIGREGIRTNFHATARPAVAATSSKTGGFLTFRQRRKGNRIPHPIPTAGREIGICGGAQSLPCVRGGGKNLLIFAGGVVLTNVNPPVSCADIPLYTRGPLDRQIPISPNKS